MATTYIHFTEEQKDQARRTDLRSFLLGQGEKERPQIRIGIQMESWWRKNHDPGKSMV